MKTLIVIANVALAALLAAAVFPLLKPTPEVPRPTASKSGSSKAKSANRGDKNRKTEQTAKTAVPATRENCTNDIVNADIFNAERTPNAAFGRRNVRVELALVGVIEAGKYRAAIIIQRTNTRQVNPFMRMMWGGPGGPGGPGGAPGGGGRGGNRRFGAGMPQRPGQNRNNPNVVKQYVKIGETMPNGYKLTALTRNRATLTRGGDKMELELQLPSKNQNAGRRTQQRLNTNQQLQQAQLMTQQMMVRALMDMRNSGGGRGGAGGGNRGGGNRGGGGRGGRR